jgi:hypothetical protein
MLTHVRYGDHVLAVLISNLPKRRENDERNGVEVIRLTQLLMQHSSKEEVHCSYKYKRRDGFELGPASLLHCALARNNAGLSILDVLNLIVEKQYDLEARDINGNTPLLYALFYVPQPGIFEVVAALVNKYGEGCLHLFLRRLSACNNHGIKVKSKDDIVNMLVVLLEKNCDPLLSNVVGFTPLDAAMSPVAWPLFCRALDIVGRDLKKAIVSLDRRHGILQLDCEIESRMTKRLKLGRALPLFPSEAQVQYFIATPCYLCGHSESSPVIPRDIPFDEFYSVVVKELKFGLHMVCHKHHHKTECMKVFKEDSCHFLDYCPSKMNIEELQERSWRRHVAYSMWCKGLL